MSSTFTDVCATLRRTAQVRHAQDALRAQHGHGAARWVSGEAGIAERTARRWLSDAYPPSRAQTILTLVSDSVIVAQRLKTATEIHVGRCDVYYKGSGKPEGSRLIRSVTISSNVAGYLGEAAADLIAEYSTGAEEAFSNAIICGYDDGLEDTLGISLYDTDNDADGVRIDH